MTTKQITFIKHLEKATDLLNSAVTGCCSALQIAVLGGLGDQCVRYPRAAEESGIKEFNSKEEDIRDYVTYTKLISLLNIYFKPHEYAVGYWWSQSELGRDERILALSFLIDIIETENLFTGE